MGVKHKTLDTFFCLLLPNISYLLLLSFFSLTVFVPADGAAISLHCIHSGARQHMFSRSPTDMHCTLLKERKKKSGLVPECTQLFVEISGNFLVFFLQGEKRKAQSFFIGWARGVAITLTCACSFSPRCVRTDSVFHRSCLLQLQRGCPWAQCRGFYSCGTWWVGWAGPNVSASMDGRHYGRK